MVTLKQVQKSEPWEQSEAYGVGLSVFLSGRSFGAALTAVRRGVVDGGVEVVLPD